ncbi:MAG: HsdR family type I site-specific deoxyribonuclease [Syntrophomonadaceae bacterium]|jgi:type I restriction enzyme R subunit|nr:HsdR family type I site-specific deoxyribonuclease [Syntrophomonadaceae bacterium]NLF44838.1 HsdR family type I site-specific deoxyribonuclease [Syntrophomonadaceae bacterium]
MTKVGKPERITQNRIIELFTNKLGYTYIGNLHDQNNSNINEPLLKDYLKKRGYSDELIRRGINSLADAAKKPDLYAANKEVYSLLRYGSSEKEDVAIKNQPVKFINWQEPYENDYYIAEEVTVVGENTKRPDIMLYINGIAVGVLELKRSIVSVSQGIRQNLDNQTDDFIRPFFSTIQLLMAGNDTEGLRFGVIDTPEKYYIEWKEDEKAADFLSLQVKELSKDEFYKLDRHLISLCHKERLLDIISNFMVFDSGTKKICRHNQYFGVLAAQERIKAKEGGIIWHTQGSGKSLTMVWLSRWIKENIPEARVLIVTDREELDDQIENKVFGADGVGDEIYRTKSSADLIAKLDATIPRMMCSLIHKFGKHNDNDDKAYNSYIEGLLANLPPNFKAKGEFYIFVDECHRTQSGKLHDAMKTIITDAVFIGFTGTPLLSRKEMKRRKIQSSIEIFGTYIHTYKYPEAVADKVVLDLRYEARDVPQDVVSQNKIDLWFDTKTKGLTDTAKARLKKRWGTLKEIYSSEARLSKIVSDIIFDFEIKDRLNNDRGNAILIATSIYEACKYYKLFTDSGFNKCAIVTSYTADISEIKGEATGESRDTENRFKYAIYQKMLNGKDIKPFEDEAKEKFLKEPGQMKLLIVVDKLLTGFDAPSATYLYIDKSMRDHGLFQAICRVNRLDGDDKEYGYIVDYMDLFKSLEKAVEDYTSEVFDTFEKEDVIGLLKNRAKEAKSHLEELLQSLRALCEPVAYPQTTIEFIRYFCWEEDGDLDQLEANESKRQTLYTLTASVLRAFAEVIDNLDDLDYSTDQIETIKKEVTLYNKIREEIRLASSDYIDLKKYEADMRYLIDTYISAGESEKISAFDDMSLIEIILEHGVDFVKSMPDGIKNNRDAAAETIENNVRRKIIEKSGTNPRYYEKMSELLTKIIEERKSHKKEYKEYLQKIVELTRKVEKPEEYSGYPIKIKESPALMALYDNYSNNEEIIIQIDQMIKKIKPDKWLGDKAKEKVIQRGIYSMVHEEDAVEIIFDIATKQKEYW